VSVKWNLNKLVEKIVHNFAYQVFHFTEDFSSFAARVRKNLKFGLFLLISKSKSTIFKCKKVSHDCLYIGLKAIKHVEKRARF
jgi:hypothetical protein